MFLSWTWCAAAAVERGTLPRRRIGASATRQDWHKLGWTGYTFDPNLFPDPKRALGSLRSRGLRIGANLHDADGVAASEAQYEPMARANGIDPASRRTVPFRVDNMTYAYSLEDIVLKPLEGIGMDFWWIDWQQVRGRHCPAPRAARPTRTADPRASRTARVAARA